MKCPYCGEETQEGYLQCSYALMWSPDILSSFILPRGEHDFAVTDRKRLFHPHAVPTSFCPTCRVLISHLPKQE